MSDALRRFGRILPRSARNWVRSPRATAAWAWDELLHHAGRDRVEEIRPGWRVRCHPGAYRLGYRAHVHDPEQARELDAFVRSCEHDMVLFDLGAHFGLFSLAAAHYGGPGARAVAVEPSAFACRILRQQATMNGAGTQIAVVEAAIADRPGTRDMIPVGVIAAGYFSPATETYGTAERRTVPAVTVDGLAEERGIWPTHVKIDVEGTEVEALRGAGAALSRDRAPVLFVELHNAMLRERGRDPGKTLDLLDDAGYRLCGLDGAGVSRRAVLGRDLTRVVARRSAR
ncbi:MAG: FkbM family methyltransferase [Gemmatimonadetes bacterium]|nr:FkbM family methyltransferase [Gemmatimonadota bacterium]